ncbi:MAG: Gfo/Idh/MocA family oxidoreductase [Planctomycetota bacterium]|nr:Gfo/Idh/MocA family oxidoreductase [Planctomycetota bacterium]
MSKKKMRFGVIGPGGAGRNRVMRLVQSTPSVEVVAAADTNDACITQLEESLGYKVEHLTNRSAYKKLIDKMDVDAVGVFSPHTLHYEHAKYALEAGKHVLIEKPMVCGVGNALETAHIAAKNDLVYLIHYQRHFAAKFYTLRQQLRRGAIGEVQSFYIYMAQDWSGHSWRGDPRFSGGGQLNDSGSHYLDILLWMTDLLPKSAEGSADYYYQGEKKRVPINGSFNVELSNGAAGRVVILGDYIHGFREDIRIKGDKGVLFFQDEKLMLVKPGKQLEEIPLSVPKNYPACPADNFGRLLTGRSKVNHVPPTFGARVALLTDAILEAAATGKKIECAKLLKKSGHDMKALSQ